MAMGFPVSGHLCGHPPVAPINCGPVAKDNECNVWEDKFPGNGTIMYIFIGENKSTGRHSNPEHQVSVKISTGVISSKL